MRMYKFHDDYRVEGDIDFECLWVLIAEFDESVQGESLFLTFLGGEHGFIDSLFLLFTEFNLYHRVVT